MSCSTTMQGRIVGIELLDAKAQLPSDALDQVAALSECAYQGGNHYIAAATAELDLLPVMQVLDLRSLCLHFALPTASLNRSNSDSRSSFFRVEYVI